MNHYFDILELQPGATPEEVKAAYRDLAKVWHPDRFREDSPRLKAKAAEKLAEINEAYEKIRAYQTRQRARKQANPNGERTDSSQNYTGYRPFTPGSSTGTGQSYSGYARPTDGRSQRRSGSSTFRSAPNPSHRSSRSHASYRTGSGTSSHQSFRHSANASYQGSRSTASAQTLARHSLAMQRGPYGRRYSYSRRRSKRSNHTMVMYLSIVAVLAVTVAGTVFYMNKTRSDQQRSLAYFPPRVLPEVGVPASVGGDPVQNSESEASGLVDTAGSTPPPHKAYQRSPRLNPARHAGGPVDPGFFTLGSTKTDVIALQGMPDQNRNSVFRYGFSSVFFEDDRVVGWHQSPGRQLKVQLTPRRGYDMERFTVGSTRDQVVALQGTPDHFGDGGRELRYGESRITFLRGRVISWHQNPRSPLKVELLPETPSDATHFTLNSTKDEVLSVQGTPDHFSENSYHYGHSMVHFKNDTVSGWNEATNYPLRVELTPSLPTSAKYFTKGSTRNEVIAAQGTPDQYSERMLKYGYSTVSFENDQVVSWYESAASPLKIPKDSVR